MKQMSKHTFYTPVRIVAAIATVATGLAANAVDFNEDFESGLGQWTGKAGGVHTGVIVADPLASGRGNVLTFWGIAYGGDIFTADPIEVSLTTVIRFDYLGLAGLRSTPGDLGGFLGTARRLNPGPLGAGNVWYAGTQESYPDLQLHLVDDGMWHRYEVNVDDHATGALRLIIEDFGGSGSNYGDVFFDNISVTSSAFAPVPEPTAASLAILGALAAAMLRRKEV